MDTATAVLRGARAGDPGVPSPSSWQDLRDRFLELLSQPDEEAPNRWISIWHLLIGHPWYREQLALIARSILRGSGVSLQWQEDMEHDAIVLLARRLKKAAGLGINPLRAAQHFAGWMRTIITRDCLDTLRRLRRQFGATRPLPDQLPAREPRVVWEIRLDLAVALEQLEEQDRTVLLLHSNGLTLPQIAMELDLTFWKTYGTYRRALEKLRRRLV